MKRLITVLLLLSGELLFSQDLDSLNALGKSLVCRDIVKSDSLADYVVLKAGLNNPKAAGYALKNKGTNRICAGDLKGSITIFKEAITLLKSANELSGAGATLNNLAIAYYRLGWLDSAQFTRKEQVRTAIVLKDSIVLSAAYLGLSALFLDKAQQDSSIYYSYEALKVIEAAGIPHQQANVFLNIGSAHFQNKDFREALTHYKKAQPLFEAQNDRNNLGLLYHNVAGIYGKLNQWDSSFLYFDKSIAHNQKTNNPYALAFSYQGLADTYYQTGNYQQSIRYNLLAKQYSEQTGQQKNLASVLKNLGSAYRQVGKLDSAILYLKQSLLIAENEGYLNQESDSYQFLSETYEAKGDIRSALANYKRYMERYQEYLNTEKSNQISELQTKYETEQKDNEIASLSQQAQIQQLLINQRNIQLIGAGVILLLLIIGGSFYYQQRKIRHQQSVSDLEQRMLRLQMNPHFIFNALASIQNYILKNDTKESVQYLSKFGRLMRQILEQSRQEYITVAEEIDMLKNYLSIQQLRFKQLKKYTFDVDVDLDVEEVRIPPLFTQPFVENALEHGLVDPEKEGEITIRIKLETNEEVSIEVIDNGQGVINAPNSEKSHQSLATSITHERIALLSRKYKRHFNLEVSSNSMGGTTARLIVPGQL